jgi:[ribosomal protein S5]-alanine N-acetyltransferase
MSPLGGPLAKIDLPIQTPRLALRLPRLSDVPVLVRYLNDPDVFDPVFTQHARLTTENERKWVRSSRLAARAGTSLSLAITLREGGTHIGGVGLEVRDVDNRRGWIGYWLAQPYWRQGFASEAASAVCRIGFRTLRLHRIDAAVFAFNHRSMALLRRLGFKVEGKKRDCLYRWGQWHDEVLFGLLAADFRPTGKGRSG